MFNCIRTAVRPLYSKSRKFATVRDGRLWLKDRGEPVPWLWLRDACPCSACVHPSTKQKLHRTSDIPFDIAPLPDAPIVVSDDSVSVEWPETHSSYFLSDPHKSVYPAFLLHRLTSVKTLADHFGPLKGENELVSWNAAQLSRSKTLWVSYSSLRKSALCLAEALKQLASYGILFIANVPTSPTDHNSCELRCLARYFGKLRSTFYGEVWDVKSIPQSRNIAYTDLDLDLHMDLLYLESPPRYQILHSLRNRVIGGTSIFVDAFERACTLQSRDETLFNVLTDTLINFHYNNDGHFHHYAHPTIQIRPCRTRGPLEIQHVNYSPPFQGPISFDTPKEVWQALRAFASLLEAPSARYEYTMREGDAVIFDNRRILHARTSFRDNAKANGNEPQRWLKGCYLEADALLEKIRYAT